MFLKKAKDIFLQKLTNRHQEREERIHVVNDIDESLIVRIGGAHLPPPVHPEGGEYGEWHVQDHGQQDQDEYEHLRPGNGAHGLAEERVTDRYETLDGEREDQPDAQETADGRQVVQGLAEAPPVGRNGAWLGVTNSWW